MGPRRPLRPGAAAPAAGKRTLGRPMVVGALLVAMAAATFALAGEAHPWAAHLPVTAPAPAAPPIELTALDALELSASLRGHPRRGELDASLRVRYRLDASDYLAAKRGDAHDLDVVHAAAQERARRDALLDWFAERCEGAWRAWQVRLLPLAPGVARGSPTSEAEGAYLAALRRVLARDATQPATRGDVGACRLEAWSPHVSLDRDAPFVRLERAEARLAARAAGLAHAILPPSVWIDVDVRAAVDDASATTLRAGLDIPFTLAGRGELALGVDPAGPDLRVNWRPPSIDDRIVGRHERSLTGQGGDEPDVEVRHAEHVARRADEAALARADATRYWTGACGGSDPVGIVACLEAPGPAVRDDLLRAIDAELGAVRAMLALVAASGHDLGALLRGESGAPPR